MLVNYKQKLPLRYRYTYSVFCIAIILFLRFCLIIRNNTQLYSLLIFSNIFKIVKMPNILIFGCKYNQDTSYTAHMKFSTNTEILNIT